MSLPDELAGPLALAGDRVGAFAGRVQWHAEVTSTNDVAAVLAEHGAEEGTVVVAHAQSAGRGRLGRLWVSPPGAGLYVSTVLRPRAAAASLLTLAAGVALVDAVREATGLVVSLKWPNDLYAGTRKLAGILAEGGSTATALQHVVVGFGINLMPASYPPDVASRATSIEEELGRPVERGLLLVACLSHLWAGYTALARGRSGAVLDAWRVRAAPWLGRRVEWALDGVRRTGVAEGIDAGGALLVYTEAGIVRVVAGEVRWL